MLNNIPEDIKAEALLDYYGDSPMSIHIKGLHKRNACLDILDMSGSAGMATSISLARKSLYDILPEYFFHPYGRFVGLRQDEFEEEYEKEQEEIEKATAFFQPIDLALLAVKTWVHRETGEFASSNKVLIDMISDRLDTGQRSNPFIAKALPFLPYVKSIRGNQTEISLILRKIFESERLTVYKVFYDECMVDQTPRYQDSEYGELGETFAGNTYIENVLRYEVVYWPNECTDSFLQTAAKIEEFEAFMNDYFISVEERLSIVLNEEREVILSGTENVNYLNYNANL